MNLFVNDYLGFLKIGKAISEKHIGMHFLFSLKFSNSILKSFD